MSYACVKAHQSALPVPCLCQLFDIHPSGHYAWEKPAKSAQTQTNRCLTGLIKQCWLESGGVYGYPKIHQVRQELGKSSGKTACAV